MNTWIVGNAPVGHHIIYPRKDEDSTKNVEGARTFFMKARIMAGQCNIEKNELGYVDYKWLSRQEVKRHVSPRYYGWVKNMLADR
jgi:large subunit ribosomal protein L46